MLENAARVVMKWFGDPTVTASTAFENPTFAAGNAAQWGANAGIGVSDDGFTKNSPRNVLYDSDTIYMPSKAAWAAVRQLEKARVRTSTSESQDELEERLLAGNLADTDPTDPWNTILTNNIIDIWVVYDEVAEVTTQQQDATSQYNQSMNDDLAAARAAARGQS